MKSWDELKQEGSGHYRADGVQPIDLYRSLGTLRHWAINEICQHAIRNIEPGPKHDEDMKKIIHYAELLMAERNSP